MTRAVILATAAMCLVGSAAGIAHTGAIANLTLAPGRPRLGAAARVTVITPDTGTFSRLGRRVSLTADMPMHAMPPVQVKLSATDDPNVYAGDIAFTMVGDWRVELRLQTIDETMTAPLQVRVLSGDQPADASAGQFVLTLQDVAAPSGLRPEYVLGSAILLALAMEGTAILFARRRGVRMSPGR